ncbi:MAG: FAD-dependent oxidoreductase [Prevotellaceae bacterium]|jgi:protoporphyrinogen oxidase|nr:FAD-dependent oxidoreductase [Prevotellaceae bacterium]
MERKKVAVIGAGPAGLTAAYELAKDPSIEVSVYECGDGPGGMCKSLRLWDCTVDVGPHRFFSYDARVNGLWLEVAGKDYKMVNRLTRIYYRGRFFRYPIAPFDALKKVGLWTAVQCVCSYLKERIAPLRSDGSFETWVCHRFGKKLYRMFFKTYSEKLWGMNCRDLDDDFASQRIKKLSLAAVVVNACKGGKTSHKTLVDAFAYPTGGTGEVYRKMAAAVIDRGGKVYYNTKIRGLEIADGAARGIVFDVDGARAYFDQIVVTMPLTEVLPTMAGVPEAVLQKASGLRYRNTVMVYLQVEGTALFPDNWLYVHSPELQMGRITNFRNWVPELYGDTNYTVLAVEYWCNEEDERWQWPDQAFIQLAAEELRSTGLLKNGRVLDGAVYRVPKSYPAYHKGYRDNLTPVEDYLKTIGHCHFIGRYGAFKYNNQDHSILMGWMAAQNIRFGAGYDLWAVNTDYDNYQEASLIRDEMMNIDERVKE